MLNVGKIEEGFVLDHIKAGKSLSIYKHLGLDKLDCTVATLTRLTLTFWDLLTTISPSMSSKIQKSCRNVSSLCPVKSRMC